MYICVLPLGVGVSRSISKNSYALCMFRFCWHFRDIQSVCEHLTVDSDTDYVFPVIYTHIYLYDSFLSVTLFTELTSFPDDIKVSKRKCPQMSSILKAYMAQ